MGLLKHGRRHLCLEPRYGQELGLPKAKARLLFFRNSAMMKQDRLKQLRILRTEPSTTTTCFVAYSSLICSVSYDGGVDDFGQTFILGSGCDLQVLKVLLHEEQHKRIATYVTSNSELPWHSHRISRTSIV